MYALSLPVKNIRVEHPALFSHNAVPTSSGTLLFPVGGQKGLLRIRTNKSRQIHPLILKRQEFGRRNRTQTGLAMEILWPVGSSAPVCLSSRKTMTLSLPWLATRQNSPVGSMLKFRGVLMSAVSCSTKVSVPLVRSTL